MALDLSTLTPEEAITAFYIGYYERAADPEGLAFWVNVLDMTSLDLTAIASDFAGQQETTDAYPFFENPTEAGASAFISQLYLNLFERTDVDAAGLEFWTDVLLASINEEEGALSVGEIIIQIISGAQDTAAGNDLTTIRNKIEVATAFTAAADAEGITAFAEGSDVRAQSTSIIENVTSEGSTVVAAKNAISDFFTNSGGGDGGVEGDFFILNGGAREVQDGTAGNDTFDAVNGELVDGDIINGGAGRDVLNYFNSVDGVAKSPITDGVEQFVITNQSNDLNAVADNNVGGYGGFGIDGTSEVDVEIDGGQMSGITRWENHDSRADVVIEDARDLDDTDGTFTGDITVAMVSTDPGNVDYAVYFDGPTNTSQSFGTVEIRVLDQEAATGLPQPSASSTGYLTESSLIEFTFEYNGQSIRVVLADQLGVTYGPNVSFQDLLEQVEGATAQALADAGITDINAAASFGAPVSVGVGNQFTLPIILTFDVPADTITANPNNVIVLGRDSGNNNATDTFGALATDRQTVEELIRLNVELDDVGKGSMGGDAMFGAMSTGRQSGDDRTSDSIGIQQFNIEVDRSSQLQTIASTNNSLQVVNIVNGENDGPNNTTTAADEQIGDLVVRGVANPGVVIDDNETTDIANDDTPSGNSASGVATDSPMPGAVPQHNIFGFTDVRVINAATMVGAVDLTAVLTEEVVEKYMNIQDNQADGNADDVIFDYDLGTNNDEFFLQMSADALNSAGTGSREDFRLDIDGNGGNDVITTNIGGSSENYSPLFPLTVGADATGAIKLIDEQGQDYYILNTTNDEDWYENTVFNGAASFSVDGGAGNDTIWTNGWGNFDIADGTGMDVVYTDNSGVVQLSNIATNIDRNLLEHDQIDYVAGSVWVFNGEDDAGAISGTGGNFAQLSGDTNDTFIIGQIATSQPTSFTSGSAVINVAFEGLTATAAEAYNSTATIALAAGNYDAVSTSATFGDITITEQRMNQAIKEAINGNAVLSNVLEAVDGPGNSLIVYSKIDGAVIDADTLNVTVQSVTVNTTAATVVNGNTAYTLEGYENFAAVNPVNTLTPGDSAAESDNTITAAGDNMADVFVLSSNDANGGSQPIVNTGTLAASELNGASNETINWNSGFGVDTVFNFDAGDTSGVVDGAEDVFDFTAITGVTNNALIGTGVPVDTNATTATGSVDIVTLAHVDGADGSATNGTIEMAEILALAGAGDTISSGTTVGASNHLYIVYDSNGQNGGEVWHVVDGAAATGDVTATEMGTINLVGTDWNALTADNIA